jgi:uncharacterized protein
MRKITISNKKEIEMIIEKAQVCYLAMVDEGLPYVVPMNFGYLDGDFILHSGKPGKKMEILRKNNQVCLSLDVESRLNVISENTACSYSMKFKSIVAKGKIIFVEEYERKVQMMNVIMKHYTGREFTYNRPAIDNVEIMIIKVEELTAINRGE